MIIVDEGGEGAEQRPKSLTQIDERRRHRPRPHPHHRRKAPNDVYAYANRYFINSCVSEVCQNSSRTGLDYLKIFLFHSPAAILLHRFICPSSLFSFFAATSSSPYTLSFPSKFTLSLFRTLAPCLQSYYLLQQALVSTNRTTVFLDRMIYCLLHENVRVYTQDSE